MPSIHQWLEARSTSATARSLCTPRPASTVSVLRDMDSAIDSGEHSVLRAGKTTAALTLCSSGRTNRPAAGRKQGRRKQGGRNTMLCYPCAQQGVERPAVVTCRSCSAGLCFVHLREATAWLAPNPLSGCHHDTWRVPSSPPQQPSADEPRLRTIFSSPRYFPTAPRAETPRGSGSRLERYVSPVAVVGARALRRDARCICVPTPRRADAAAAAGSTRSRRLRESLTTYASAQSSIRCPRLLASARSADDPERSQPRRWFGSPSASSCLSLRRAS